MDSTPRPIAILASTSTDAAAIERWELWTQKGRDHEQLMLERWRELATTLLMLSLLTAATILALR